jgi:tetratricopeptide (TPR) repeat protein
LILRESQVQPLLVLFEDLHWIDAGTQALLDGLVESLPTARLLLLVNYRPEYQHPWSSKTYYRQLRIDPLPPAGAEELLHPLLGDDRSLAPLKRLLIERTEGNPLFLEESVRALVETQVLIGDRGRYRLAREPSAIQVPATVQAILAARIDRLADEDKRLLQTASVIGKDVPLALLEAVAELPEDVLRECLARFQSAEFLYEASLFPEPEYTFKHALTHEVAYRGLLQERRHALHARIVDAMERLYADRLAEHVERLAHHALHGSVTEKAVLYLRQAGARAVARFANHEAVEFFRQALEALATLPETPERLTDALDIELALGPALMASTGAATPELDALYQRTRALSARLGDKTRLFTALWGQWYTTQWRGRYRAARELGEELLRVARSTGDPGLLLESFHSLWSSCYLLGDLPAVAEHHERGLALYDPRKHHAQTFLYGGHDPGVCCLMQSGVTLWALGYPDQGLRRSRESLRLADELGHPLTTTVAHYFATWAYYSRGEPAMAVAMVEIARTTATAHGLSVWVEQAERLRAAITANQAQAGDVASQLERALAAARATGWGYKEVWSVAPLVEAFGYAEHTAEALDLVTEMFGQDSVVSFYEPELGLLWGRLLAASGDDQHAEAAFRRAIAVARARHARSVELQTATELARLLARKERPKEARQLLAETYGWFTEGSDTVHLKTAKALLDDLS